MPRNAFERALETSLKRRKVKFEYEGEKIPYSIHATYCPDFVLENGVVIEAKGYLDTETKRKMIAVKKQHPERDIRFVFYDAYKKVSGTKQKHWEWAAKNGFPWAHEVIPDEWLN